MQQDTRYVCCSNLAFVPKIDLGLYEGIEFIEGSCKNCGAPLTQCSNKHNGSIQPEIWYLAQTPRREKRKFAISFGMICVLLGLSPLLLLLINIPIIWLFDCSGNEGAGVGCLKAPGYSEIANSVFGLGIWGPFITLPVSVCLYIVGAIIRYISRRVSE